MDMTIAELTGQALTEAEAQAVLTTKREAEAVKRELGELVTGHRPKPQNTVKA
jgi:cell division ATPase FtsA